MSEDYKLLNIDPNTTVDDIKKAFRKRAFDLHPDRNKDPNANKQFIELKNAFERIMKQKEIPQSEWQWNVVFTSEPTETQTYTIIITYT